LAERLHWTWCDADALLEQRHGKTIRQIFAEEGESGFRDREAAILHDLAQERQRVIATGGGVILRDDNRRCLKESGAVIWLSAPADVLWQRLQQDASTGERRPNLAQGGLAEIVDLLRMRQPWYAECASLIVDSDKPIAAVVDKIVAW